MDTVKLLKECDAGAKMAVEAIEEVVEKVKDDGLKQLLQTSQAKHKELEKEIEELLAQEGFTEKEPAAMAKGMSWIKINMKMSMDSSDKTVADVITDGCNMGIKSLYRYKNQYQNGDRKAKELCNRLIELEEKLRQDLREHL